MAVPYAPLLGILINTLLLAQLSAWGLGLMVAYFALAATFYLTYGIHHSIGNNSGWRDVLRETHRYGGEADRDGDRGLEGDLAVQIGGRDDAVYGYVPLDTSLGKDVAVAVAPEALAVTQRKLS